MFVIPDWCNRLLPYFRLDGPTGAGVSGGRTSGMMHALIEAANPDLSEYQPCFANTGKEDEQTLRFVRDIDRHSRSDLRWLEFRPPEQWGMAPRFSRSADVSFETAHRGPQVWEDFLRTLAEYRRVEKDEGPVAPYANMRMCTAYMKTRVMHNALNGWDSYDTMIGLRADEPERVNRLIASGSQRRGFRCPLFDAGITREMVLDFWAMQPFDLQLEEPRGNCSLCFLKDEADLATLMLEDEDDARWWLDVQSRYGDFRRGGTSMRTIFAEARVRVQVIRPAVKVYDYPEMPATFSADPVWLHEAQREAECAYQRRLFKWEERRLSGEPFLPKPRPGGALSRTPEQWAQYRWGLLVKQEQRLRDEGRRAFSCACESAQVAALDDDDRQVRFA